MLILKTFSADLKWELWFMRMKTSIETTFDTEEQSNYKKVRDSKAPWIQFVPDAEKARMQKLQCIKISCIKFYTDQHFSGFFAHTLLINKRLDQWQKRFLVIFFFIKSLFFLPISQMKLCCKNHHRTKKALIIWLQFNRPS